VARAQLDDKLELATQKEGLIQMFSVLHKSVESISIRFREELKR